eukprot:175967-Chlamydomonas_euryale.AAC.1
MDFMTGLPESKTLATDMRCYDAIMVVVDRLTKHVTLIPTFKDVSSLDLATLLHKHVVSRVGVPKTIVTDRQSVLIS